MTKEKMDPYVKAEKKKAHFWDRVDRDKTKNGCWEWTGGRLKGRGYGKLWWNDKQEYAHRIAWLLTNHGQELPTGRKEIIRHSCNNPPCCRPSHLFRGTMLENMRDRDAGGRNTLCKFTDHQVREIRYQYATNHFSIPKLAERHNVTRVTIQKMVKHETYRWV